MIIYGWKPTGIATENIREKCPHCGTPDSLQMDIYQKYAHVYWIPLFPIGKTAATQCSHCQQVLQKKEFPPDLQYAYETLKIHAKTPVWTFSGLGILALLIAWGIISSKQTDEKNARLILSPQKGDLYEISINTNRYTLYKVEKVAGDSVFLLFNQYESNKESGLSDLKNKGNEAFSTELMPLHKNELKTMLDLREIISIDRK